MIRAPAGDDWRLECDHLSIRRGGRLAVQDVSLTLRRGECISLIGPNGSGKTSLLLAMLGLIHPAAGSVRLDGHVLHRLPARARGLFAAYVPQTTERLPGFSVFDVVAAGRYPHAAPLRPLSAADERVVGDVIRECGLSQIIERPIHAVSGGERQKTLLAAALAQDAQALMLDEPDTALDPAYQIELVRLLARWRARGRAMVLISHDLQFPTALGGRVIAMRDGQIVADGPAATVLTAEVLSGVYGARFVALQTPTGKLVPTPWLGDGAEGDS
ncbi:MAG: ABC transporter ATP-binding protein [Phycisphaerae bacterium]